VKEEIPSWPHAKHICIHFRIMLLNEKIKSETVMKHLLASSRNQSSSLFFFASSLDLDLCWFCKFNHHLAL